MTSTLDYGTAYLRQAPFEVEAAARTVAAFSTATTRRQALACFAIAGNAGLNDDELSAVLDQRFPRDDGFTHNPSKIASRRKELMENAKDGVPVGPPLVEALDQERPTRRRCNGIVHRITEAGIAELAFYA